MGAAAKILARILSGQVKNIRFADFQKLLEALGFQLARTSGSHHIYTHPAVHELVNIQNVNGEAKPYQIKQVLALVETYGLSLKDK